MKNINEIKNEIKNVYNSWLENHHNKYPISISFTDYLDLYYSLKIKNEQKEKQEKELKLHYILGEFGLNNKTHEQAHKEIINLFK